MCHFLRGTEALGNTASASCRDVGAGNSLIHSMFMTVYALSWCVGVFVVGLCVGA